MDRSNRPGNRRDNRVPHGLSFIMWPALVRAPWLIGDLMAIDGGHAAERRRRRDR